MALKILIYCDDHGTGGAAAATRRLALGLAERGHEIVYVQSRQDSPWLADAAARGVRHVAIPYDTIRYYWPSVVDTRNPARVLLDERPDLAVFSDSMAESFMGAKEAAALLNIPYVAIKHLVVVDGLYAHDPAVGARVGRAIAASAATITVSEQNRATLLARYPDQADRIVAIHNSAPDLFFAPAEPGRRASFRQRFAIPDDAVVVLTAAALVQRKGFHHQVRLLERLKAAGVLERFVFVWAGEEDQPYIAPLWRRLEETGCAGQVRRIGYQSDVAWCLDGADVMLLPSEQEALGLINLEAMARGVPVVASAVGGIPEAVGTGPDAGGILFPDPVQDPAGAVDGMARALLALAGDPAGRARLGEAGRRRARTRFSNAVILDRYEAAFRRAALEPGDWTAPGLAVVGTGWALPHARPVPREKLPAALHARPQPRYADARFPRMPFHPATRDEALILYNAALRLPGGRALEAGLSFGWIAWHLLAAGMSVDIADPFLAHPELRAAAADIQFLDISRRVRLVIGGAEMLDAAIAGDADRWSLMSIDGGRETLDPVAAAAACARLAAPDALIFIHGAAAAKPAQALADLAAAGWRTRLYRTQGPLGVAWRGAVAPPDHQPDPALDAPPPDPAPDAARTS